MQHFRRESAGHNKGQNEHSENFVVILLGCQRELEGAAVLRAGGRGDWLSHGSDCSYYLCQLLGDPCEMRGSSQPCPSRQTLPAQLPQCQQGWFVTHSLALSLVVVNKQQPHLCSGVRAAKSLQKV